MKTTEHNIMSGEIVTRQMNENELQAFEAQRVDTETRIATANARAAALESARNKLAALGLTPEEIAAFLG